MKIGAVKLAKWLAENNMNSHQLSRALDLYPATIHRILNGTHCPGIAAAIKIRNFTDSAVDFEDWITEKKK